MSFSSCVGVQGQESDSSEASVRGPRIKHVCRRAAVALGRNRAVFPDDMPTLSALPWEEREKILSSMGNDGEAPLLLLLHQEVREVFKTRRRPDS